MENIKNNFSRGPLMHPVGKPISICISNGEAYVWGVDQVRRLRVDHQICGLLTGTLPQLAQQNVFLGLPLQLMPEEVFCLVEAGIAILIDDKRSHRSPSLQEAAAYRTEEEERVAHERQAITIREAERRAAMRDQYRSKIEIAEEIRRARDEQAKESEKLSLLTEDSGTLTANNQTSKAKTPEVHYHIPVRLQSEGPTYSSEDSFSYNDLESARASEIWTYPTGKYQRARCAVFNSLWKRGMFLGIGLKFGCDFLVYPGDSLRFHSHFACTVISDPLEAIEPLALVSYGRLATAVKKSHLLACWDEEKNEVKYMSLEWAGMG